MGTLKCSNCGNDMIFLSSERIQLGKTGWLLGDLPNLFAGALDVNIYICQNCKKLEFFAANDDYCSETLPQKTCPNCGCIHDFDYPRCPECGFEE